MSSKQTVIHWFRKGLRIHDNPALTSAIDTVLENPETMVLRPIFILDPGIKDFIRVGANRWRFLQESLEQLDDNLRILNSRLYVVRGHPVDVFVRLFKEWNVCKLTFEHDIEPYALKRDAEVEKMAQRGGIEVEIERSETIYDHEEILRKNKGKAPLTYVGFLKLASSCQLAPPLDPPRKLPKGKKPPPPDSEERKRSGCYDVPTLAELVDDQSHLGPRKYPGGETEALLRMEKQLKRVDFVCNFDKPSTSPNSLEPSTTVLSPYIKFGCLSARLLFRRLNETIAGRRHTDPPVSLVGQLVWREMYYCAAAVTPNFAQMRGNSICVQIPWTEDAALLEAWSLGRTGYPFIDACMRQLRREGWIHHLARHAVGCFLTRGDLWQSWEAGARVFEELLLDADWALNAANWMWISCSAFFHHYIRVYSPVAFGRKTDPAGNFIREYVPELRKYPAELIYEPWKASKATQRRFGCVVGEDYPERVVIHEEVAKPNMKRMTEAYQKNRARKQGFNVEATAAVGGEHSGEKAASKKKPAAEKKEGGKRSKK